jgi:pyrroloquinoline quinone biosynthesis protein B
MKLIVLRGGASLCPNDRIAAAEPAATGHRGAMALSDNGDQWVLLNLAPNVACQLQTDPALQPHAGLRQGEARTVLLTDAQVDHISGLLSLRDGPPIDLYATPAVFEVLSQTMPVLQILQQFCGVHWHVIPVAGETLSATFHVAALPELEFTALATESPVPIGLGALDVPATTGLSIALAVRDPRTGQRLFCAPGAQALGAAQYDWLRSADCVLLDEHTTWPEAAVNDAEAWLAQRKVLFGDAPALSNPGNAGGFEAAHDGMVIEL